jgi:hypothetical protein
MIGDRLEGPVTADELIGMVDAARGKRS